MKRFQLGLLAFGVATVGYGVALRQDWLVRKPAVLAAMVGVLLLGCVLRLVLEVVGMARARRPDARGLGAVLGLGGLVLTAGAGMANWAFSFQGMVVLTEGEAIPLAAASHLIAFEAGPLSSPDELGLTLQLEQLTLQPEGAQGFLPHTRLRLQRGSQTPVVVELDPGQPASLGPLVFHQGAFGFSPRIVVLKGEETLLDEKVPFLTEQRERVLSFTRSFTVEREQLEVNAGLDLSTLDERMKGHAKLGLEVRRAGVALGQGELSPGHFVDLAQGYRVGFAGLDRWSEVVISRKNYGQHMLVGLGATSLGTAFWLVALAWGRWRR